MSDAIPKLKSAAFDANDTLVVHLNNGKSFDFKKVMWFTVGQRLAPTRPGEPMAVFTFG